MVLWALAEEDRRKGPFDVPLVSLNYHTVTGK